MSYRVIIVGYGRSAQTLHAPAIEAAGGFCVAGVVDPDPAARERARARFGCPVFERYDDALSLGADLAVILTRNDQHAPMAQAFLRAGINALVTKPWALDEAQAREMIAARGDRLLLAWLPCRFASDIRALSRVIQSGEIGRPFMVRRAAASFGRRCDWQVRRKFGGGYLLNWGPHLIDQAATLLGGHVKSVWGQTRRVINPGDAEDSFLAILGMSGGATAMAEYQIAAPGSLPDWVVQGDEGTARIADGVLRVSRVKQPDTIDPSAYRDEAFVSERVETIDPGALYGDATEIYRHIARALGGKEEYAVSCEDALELTRVLDAVRLSGEQGRVIAL